MQSDAPKYTQAELEGFRKGLLNLLQDGPSNVEFGVCHNLNNELRDMPEIWRGAAYYFVAAEADGWPHAMRSDAGKLLDWFVPGTPEQGLWEGENLKMRQNLMHYLLCRVAHHEALLRGGAALAG